MRNMFGYWLIAMLLVAGLLVNSRELFIAACLSASIFYFLAMRTTLVFPPNMNIVGTAGAAIGFFYFAGTVPVNLGLEINPSYTAGFLYKSYRSYETSDLCLAGILVFFCTIPLLEWPLRYQPSLLRKVWTPEEYYGSAIDPRVRRDDLILGIFSITITMIGVYLAATKQLAVDFSPLDASVGNRSATTIFFIFAILGPAVPACLMYLGIRSMRAGRLPLLWFALSAPLLFTLFLSGRQTIAAGGIGAAVALVFFAGLEISRLRWFLMLVVSVVGFQVVSVPFMQARASGQFMSADRFLSSESVARAAILGRSTNMTLATTMRVDMMGELALVMKRLPADQMYLGQGMASQFAVLVPGKFWPEKKTFLQTSMIADERILERAGLPGTDIAGTPVVYAYADFGWLAPIEVLAQILLYLWSITFIIRVFGGFSTWIVATFVCISLYLRVDLDNFSSVLFYIAYTVSGALMIAALNFVLVPPGMSRFQKAPSFARLSERRAKAAA